MRIGIGVICLFLVFSGFLYAEPPGEQENFYRVRRTLDALSIPFEERAFLAAPGVFGRSILVRAAAGGYTGTFVLALPLDAEFAVDTGLALAEKMQGQSSPVNIMVAFLGNERSGVPEDSDSHQGLGDLLTLIDVPENWALCYLDIAQTPGTLVIRHGTEGYVAPLELLEPLAAFLRSSGIPWSFRVRHNEIYKLGFVEGHMALAAAWEEEVNAFVLAGTPGGTISAHDVAALLFDYAASLDFPMLKVDRHYFFLTAPGGEVFFFPQGHVVALLLIMAGICFFLFLVYSARYNALLVFHTRLFFKSCWIFFILILLLVASIAASGLLYAMLVRVFGPPLPAAMPPHAYYAGAGLVMLLAILVFFLHWPVFGLIRIPKRAQFYGFSSVIMVTTGLFIAAFLDFSFVPAFLWAFLFGFFAASLSKPAAVFLCVLFIPLFALDALLNIIETGCVRITGLFIYPDWRTPDSWLAAFQVALFSLPLILLIKRGIILCKKPARQRQKGKAGLRLIVVSVLLTLVLAGMIVQIQRLPHYAGPLPCTAGHYMEISPPQQ
ncbi:MAG: hypothetical protein FWB99_11540 [Treponema sp.]|nr:hypothetical protein [Treponema sp.]